MFLKHLNLNHLKNKSVLLAHSSGVDSCVLAHVFFKKKSQVLGSKPSTRVRFIQHIWHVFVKFLIMFISVFSTCYTVTHHRNF